MDYYTNVLRKYAVFEGRATRKEYWMFFLINFIISFILGLFDIFALSVLYMLAVFIPGIAVAIRRLHDTGRTGWWLLIGMIPIIGLIIIIVFLVQDSQTETNQYGPNPKETSSASTDKKSEHETENSEEVVINDIPTVAPEKLEDGLDNTPQEQQK